MIYLREARGTDETAGVGAGKDGGPSRLCSETQFAVGLASSMPREPHEHALLRGAQKARDTLNGLS